MNEEQARRQRVQRAVADKVTDEMLTKPTGDLTDAEATILMAALRGPYADEIIARIDEILVNKKENSNIAWEWKK